MKYAAFPEYLSLASKWPRPAAKVDDAEFSTESRISNVNCRDKYAVRSRAPVAERGAMLEVPDGFVKGLEGLV